MATRQELEAQIATIDARLNSGADQVSYQGQTVRFSLKELRRRRTELQAQLDRLDGTPRLRQARPRTCKGL